MNSSQNKLVSKFFVGVDLGKSQDYTAISVIEEQSPPSEYEADKKQKKYQIRYLDRPPLGTSYIEVGNIIARLMNRPPLSDNTPLIVDATGIGSPVVDMLRELELTPIAITITGGNEVSRGGRAYSVPKIHLITNLQILFESDGRLKIASKLPLSSVFLNELSNYRFKITPQAHLTFDPRADSSHDDLILSVALPLWYAQHGLLSWRPIPVNWGDEEKSPADGGFFVPNR